MSKEKENNDIEMFSDALVDTIENKKEDEDVKKNDQFAEKQSFNVLAIPCDRAFIVEPENVEEFKKQLSETVDITFVKKCVDTFRKNNLEKEKRVLKKVK